MPVAAGEDIKVLMRRTAEQVDEALHVQLARCDGPSPRLAEVMRYSLDAGGKRLRPVLVLWCCELCGGEQRAAMPGAVAVECVHTFSLIHDDLPALDDGDLRRGRPSSHKQFGEALAILAGDGLLALSFEILARGITGKMPVPQNIEDAAVSIAMVEELARATGHQGMIGGEAADIEGESAAPDAALVGRIHAAKTARLIEASCRLGAMAARADDKSMSALTAFGHALGLAFQASDDLLDVTVGSAALGKSAGKDETAGKQTYPRAVGIEDTRRLVAEAVDRAIGALAPFGSAASELASLARFVAERQC